MCAERCDPWHEIWRKTLGSIGRWCDRPFCNRDAPNRQLHVIVSRTCFRLR